MIYLVGSIVLIAIVFFYISIQRGKLFLQAYTYIIYYSFYLNDGKSQTEAIIKANQMAAACNIESYPGSRRENINNARNFALIHYNGKQLPVIAEARLYGFSK